MFNKYYILYKEIEVIYSSSRYSRPVRLSSKRNVISEVYVGWNSKHESLLRPELWTRSSKSLKSFDSKERRIQKSEILSHKHAKDFRLPNGWNLVRESRAGVGLIFSPGVSCPLCFIFLFFFTGLFSVPPLCFLLYIFYLLFFARISPTTFFFFFEQGASVRGVKR